MIGQAVQPGPEQIPRNLQGCTKGSKHDINPCCFLLFLMNACWVRFVFSQDVSLWIR